METYLGKIASAEFGLVEDRPYLMGLRLCFKFDGSTICNTQGKFFVNMNDENSLIQSIEMTMQINKLLLAAGCVYVSQLIGKPVEITLDGNRLEDFRILTEFL